MKKIKYIFIGGGVANLAAANKLMSVKEESFLILEKGNTLKKRNCPGVKSHSCEFCKNGCFVTEGIGGSDALFGNKLCYFPASNSITDFFSKDQFDNSMRFLDELLNPYFDSNLNSENYSQENSVKKYNATILNNNEFMDLINRLLDVLIFNNKIYSNTEVVEISKKNNYFILKTSDSRVYYCDNVIIGTGRSSVRFLIEQYNKLGIKYMNNNVDIGIRMETHYDNFSSNFTYQNDPKIKFHYQEKGIGRTFCAINRGQIVPVQFGNSFYADGIFSNNISENSNIALMVRTDERLNVDMVEDWCRGINSILHNQLTLAEFNLNEIGDTSSLIKSILSRIHIWPTAKYKELFSVFLYDIFSANYNLLKKNTKAPMLKVYGPAIDNYLPIPDLELGLATKVKNLFIIGDAVGVSRGFVQSLFSGVAWAEKMIQDKYKESALWENLV